MVQLPCAALVSALPALHMKSCIELGRTSAEHVTLRVIKDNAKRVKRVLKKQDKR